MNAALIALLAGLLGSLCLLLFVAARRRNVAAAVNTFLSLVLALLAVVLGGGYSPVTETAFSPELPLLVAVAGLLHSLGMLGFYESVWWWDHLTHTVSAMLIAALVYAALIVAADGTVPTTTIAVLTVAYTFAIGVFWELIELVARAVGERYDIEPVLVHYGWRDTAFDLVFDVLGAIVVVVADVRLFVVLAEDFPQITQSALTWTGGVVTVGSVLMALSLGVISQRHEPDR
ncbi:hypothetical protein [Halovenus marina]|uniref:hypothetical protein n=1 Tax=Halovenus marina TaxID=3396621 RepID=UPI003F5670CA